ncbi:3'(2'),5'-bisphosphate nucleotidase CysQ [Pseudomonas sp. NBRC 100443]|uniref:3'(2'),5'-bisphosphate nucleotidase CysQ n=1 Tax=Pseudomonas sp. NBRC 100443 TaxID=1113665 RepID=UPI0024A0F308|nr:3'(2'),5'-bisphosphate nucleotidase CysQ [Pseudomonas sp. NBRC 100443]GLU37321.1 3'(2'),5'-bisphosphate nucleotidase CysQ [Pseudomonas sp. NBRC 100443]
MHASEQEHLLEQVIAIARHAGALILDIYGGDIEVRGKADSSPVTAADERAEAHIVEALRQLTPDLPIVAEEAVCAGRIPALGKRFWLVDPLDGTKEFIRRNGEFTVNIALIDDQQPLLGVVLAPALGRMFAGTRDLGAFIEDIDGRRPINVRRIPEAGIDVVSSRSHGDAEALDKFLAGYQVNARLSAGSSLKLCLVASGQADLYPRLGRTMEWDIAAGHAVLNAAGGSLRTLAGDELAYGKADFANPHFVASGAEA